MPPVHPFSPLQFRSPDLSTLISPPYDVLGAPDKTRLLARNPANIVAIDLPHTPPKELGPPSAYEAAATSLRALITSGTLAKPPAPAIYAYRQTFHSGATSVQRCGVACTVDALPFGPRPGGGILPHEQTFSGPKEDRLALMKATRAQLSPIFGLHPDEESRATRLVRQVMSSRACDHRADMEGGVLHEVWSISDSPTIKSYQDALAGEDIFIADGHHRYTTQLNYIQHLEVQGRLAPDHPARRCMFVLISMSDPGLVIWPTHRVLGGMAKYSLDSFIAASQGLLNVHLLDVSLDKLESVIHDHESMHTNVFGLYDFATRRCALAVPAVADPLAMRFPAKPRAWCQLDVTLIQHLIVEDICQPKLNTGKPVTWAFPHTIKEVLAIGAGAETGAGGGGSAGFAQLAVIVRPTPLSAVREISRAGELMPQKSTFFFPKLATGLWINALE